MSYHNNKPTQQQPQQPLKRTMTRTQYFNHGRRNDRKFTIFIVTLLNIATICNGATSTLSSSSSLSSSLMSNIIRLQLELDSHHDDANEDETETYLQQQLMFPMIRRSSITSSKTLSKLADTTSLLHRFKDETHKHTRAVKLGEHEERWSVFNLQTLRGGAFGGGKNEDDSNKSSNNGGGDTNDDDDKDGAKDMGDDDDDGISQEEENDNKKDNDSSQDDDDNNDNDSSDGNQDSDETDSNKEEDEEESKFLNTVTSFFKSKTTSESATMETKDKVSITEKAKSLLSSLPSTSPSSSSSSLSSYSFFSVFRMNMEAKDEDFSEEEEENDESEYDTESEDEEEDQDDVGIVIMAMNKKKKKITKTTTTSSLSSSSSPSSMQKQGRGGGGVMMMTAAESEDEKESIKGDENDSKQKDVVDVTVVPIVNATEETTTGSKKDDKIAKENKATKKKNVTIATQDEDKEIDAEGKDAIAATNKGDSVEDVQTKTSKKKQTSKDKINPKQTEDPQQQQQKKKKKEILEQSSDDDIDKATDITNTGKIDTKKGKDQKTEINSKDDVTLEQKEEQDNATKDQKKKKQKSKQKVEELNEKKNTTKVSTEIQKELLTNKTATVTKEGKEDAGGDGNVTTIEVKDDEETRVDTKEVVVKEEEEEELVLVEVTSSYVSSGYWSTIDKIASLGLSSHHPTLRLSRQLRSVRKAAAKATGLHGVMSGKGRGWGGDSMSSSGLVGTIPHPGRSPLNEEDIGIIRSRIAAIEVAKGKVSSRSPLVEEPIESTTPVRPRRRGWGRILPRRRNNNRGNINRQLVQASVSTTTEDDLEAQMSLEEEIEKARMAAAAVEQELRRQKRVEEIDRLIVQGQEALHELQCEKDDLQRSPNPLFNYTTKAPAEPSSTTSSSPSEQTEFPDAPRTTRVFNFPPQEVVDEYIDTLVSTGRLVKLNHTQLWKSGAGEYDDDEDDSIGDDLLTPSADARKLYENVDEVAEKVRKRAKRNGNGHNNNNNHGKEKNGGGGSWLLRQTMMTGTSLGEKIGEATETAAYKAVCSAVMSILARSISALHGVNVMTHSDIRLFLEHAPDLPPLGKGVFPHGVNDNNDYAREAIEKAIIKGATKRKKKSSKSKHHHHHSHSRHHGHDLSEEAFIQRDAVVETLISHCQISAPLLKLFPLAWQRAMLGNIITLIAAVVSDFAEGIQVQILGHQLSFSFKPITESDMIQHIGLGGFRFNHRRARPEEFEAAVRATTDDISEGLQFLDRWHERAMGGGLLKLQIGNLIARVVLTLVDEVLSGARMDLWSAQAGGPRVVAGLEYRTQRNEESSTARPQ